MRIFRIFFPLLILLVLPVSLFGDNQKTTRILIIHSYHQGMGWTDRIHEGMVSALQKGLSGQSYELFVEYLDTKRINSQQHFRNLAGLFQLKYKDNPPDLILSSDDDAFSFVRENHARLFPDAPLVFCGVNYFTQRPAAENWYTGIVEEMDLSANIDLMLRLFPGVRNLMVVNDTTTTGQANRKILDELLPRYSGRLKTDIVSNITLEQLKEKAALLSNDSAMLLLTFNRDAKGRVVSYDEEIETVRKSSQAPIFGVWDFFLGQGLFGGLLLSGFEQGRKAAELGIRILNGERPASIPVSMAMGKAWIFDATELEHFHVRFSELPKGYQLIHQKNPFLKLTIRSAVMLLAGLVFLVLLLLFLIFYVIRLKTAEEALREASDRLKSILSTTAEGFWMISLRNVITDVNQTLCDLLGYTRNEMLDKNPADFVAEDNRRILEEHLAKIPYTVQRSYELVLKTRNGRSVSCRIQSSTVRDRFGNPLYAFAFIQDVTALLMAQNILRESEKKFRILAESTACGIVILQDGKIVYANPAFCTIASIPPEDTEGKRLPEIIKTRKATLQASSLLEFSDPLSGNIELPVAIEGKGDRWLDITASGIIPFGDRPSTLLTVFDITDRKKAQESLRQSESLYRTLAEASRDFIFVINSNYTIAYVNHFTAERIGARPEDLTGAPIIELFTVEFADKMTSQLARVFQTGQAVCVEDKMIFSYHDRELWLETWIIPIKSDDGRIFAALGVARDMSERKQMVDTILDERKRLSIIIGSIPEGIVAASADGMIFMMNPSAGALTGWNWQDAIGSPFHRIFREAAGERKTDWKSLFDRTLKSGKSIELERPFLYISRDGKEKMVSGNLTPIRDLDDAVTGILFVFRDVSEKMKMERQIQAMGKVESLGVLASGLAHDFNNIMTGILGNVSLARFHMTSGSTDTVAMNRILEDAESACWRARDLITQLLTFARGNRLVKKTENMGDLVKSVVEFVLRGTAIRTEFDIPADILTVEADIGQISQVIQNLAINAKEAQPSGGYFRVTATRKSLEDAAVNARWKNRVLTASEYVELIFSDGGHGISADILDRIFEPYFSTKHEGSGLGLAIATSIIRDHDGFLTVESRPGSGTDFSILLPASRNAMPLKDEKKKTIQGGKGRVLVMDDEDYIRDILSRMLATLGYSAETAPEGNTAIDMYLQAKESGRPYRLVITDLTVPGGMGGIDLVRKLRELDPGVKVIVESGYSKDTAMTNPSSHGFIGLVQKPFEISTLSAEISRVLSL